MANVFVQSNFQSTISSAASAVIPFSDSVTAGDILVAVVHGTPTFSVSDSQGNSYTLAQSFVSNFTACVWFAIAKSTGANSVTFATTSGSPVWQAGILEYTSLSSVIDVALGAGCAQGTVAQSGSFTPANSGELAIFAFGFPGGYVGLETGITSGWTLRLGPAGPESGNNSLLIVSDNVSAASGAQTTEIDLDTDFGNGAGSVVVSFALPSGGGAGSLLLVGVGH